MLSGTKQLIPKVSQGMSVVRAHNGPTNLTAFPIVSAPFPALETPIVTVYNANPIPPVAAVPVVGQNMVPQRNAEVTSHIESQSSPIAPEVSTPSTAPDLPSKPIQLSAISSGTTVSPVSLKQLIPTDSARPVSAPALKIDIQHPVGTSAASPPPLRSPAVTPSPNGNSFSFMRLGGYGFDTGDIPETYQLAPAKEMLPELVPAGVRVRTKSGIITSVRGKPGLYGIHPTPPPDPTHAKLRPVQPPEIVYLNQPPKTVPSQPGHAISEAPVPRVQTAVPVAPVNPLIVQQIPVPVLAIQPPKAFKVSRLVPASQSAVNLTTKLAYQEPVRPLLPGRQATVSSIHDTSSANESQRVSPIQTFGASPAKHLIAGLKFAPNYQQANDAKLPSLRPHANISLDSSLPLQQVSTGDDVPLTPITISALRSGSAEQVTGPDSNVKLVTPATPQVSTSPLTRKDIGPKPSYVSSIREPDQETKTPIHVIQSPVLTQVSRPAPIEEFFGRPRSNPKYQQIAISPTSGTTISSARPVSSLRFPQSQSTLNTMPGLQSPPSIQVSRPTQLYQVPKITEPKPTLPLPGQIVSGIPINVIPSGRTVQPSRRRRPAYKPLVQSSITLSEKNPKLKTVAAVDSVSPPNPQVTSSAYRQASTRLQMPTVSSVKPIRTGYVAPVPQVIQTVPHTTISISNRPTPDVPLSTPRFGQRIRPFTYAAAGPVSPATTVNAEAPLQGPVDAGRKPTQPNSISRQVADRVPIVSVINELPSSQRASQRSTFQASAQRRPLNSAAISPKTIVTSFETPQFATAVPSSITTHDKPFTVDSTLPTLTVPPLQSVHEPLTLLYETLGPNQNVNSHIDVQPVITIQLSRPKERFRVPSKTAYTTNNTSTSQLEPEKNLFSPIGPDSPDRYNGLKPRSDTRPAIIAPLSHPIQRISIPLKPAHKASRVLLEAGSPSSGRLPTPIEAVGPGRINAFTPLLNIQSADSVPLNPQIERDSVPATFTYNAPHTLQQPARPISRLPYTETSELTSTRYTDSNSRELLESQTPRDSQAVHISGQNKPISPLVSHLTSKNIQSSKPVALTSSVERTSPTNGNSFSFMRIGGYGFDHGEIPKAYQIAPAKEMLPELVPAGVRVRTKSGVISSVRGTPGLYGIHPTPPPDPTHHKKPAPAPQIVYLKETQEGPSSTSRPFLQTTHRGAPAPTAPTGVARTITAQNLTVRRPPIPTSMGQTRIPLFLSTSQPANQQTDAPTFSFGVQANTIQGYPVPSSLDLSPQIKVTLASPQPQVVPQQSPNTIPPSPHQTISALRQTANLHKASSRPQIVPLRASSPTSAPALPHIVPVSGAPHKPLAGPSNVFSPTISLNTPGGSGSYGNDLSDFEDFETPTTQVSVRDTKLTDKTLPGFNFYSSSYNSMPFDVFHIGWFCT